MLGFMENCETIQKLHQVACGSDCIFFFLKPGFGRIGVFTKYGCFYASKWPQMPQEDVPYNQTIKQKKYDLYITSMRWFW